MRARIARSVPIVPERKREGMSSAHLSRVRALPCLACGYSSRAMHAHHLKRAVPHNDGKGGAGRTSADKWAVPACFVCHAAMHGHGDDEEWLASRGIDARSIAEALWRERGNDDAMMRIVERSLLSRRVYGR
jgi:hypothetical protein